MEKAAVRKQIREVLQTLSSENIQEKSSGVSQHVFQTAWWKESEIIFAFCSMEKEVDTCEIIGIALSEAKIVAIPRVAGNDLVFHRIRSLEENFCSGFFGIREPEVSWPMLDPVTMKPQNVLIVTPGLAFDRQKNRLGRGKGFYDRFLRQVRVCHHLSLSVIGVCFSEQLLGHVPVRNHDQPVDGIITEKEVIA